MPALVALAFVLTACDGAPAQDSAPAPSALPITPTYFPTAVFFPTPTSTPAPDPIHVALIWLFHQPAHDVDAQTGLMLRPDVRLRALRAYHPVAAALRAYPALKVNASFSPVLLEQLGALAAGLRDLDFELGTREAAGLSPDDRRLIVSRFFDLLPAEADAVFPRLSELRQRRGPDPAAGAAGFSEQDLRDLQALALAASLPETARSAPPLLNVLAKGRDFTEEDKQALALATLDLLRGLLPLYRALQDQGSVDILPAPYANPILPLLMDAEAQRGARDRSGPAVAAFAWPSDGAEQLSRSFAACQAAFGRAPQGLWPSQGALSAGIADAIRQAGFAWIAGAERSLARSLDPRAAGGFARDAAGLVAQPDALYRPYRLDLPSSGSLAVVFGDERLSSDIQAAGGAGLIDRLRAVKAQLRQQATPGPHLVTLVFDGDRADPAFIEAAYAALAQATVDGEVATVALSDYLAGYGEMRRLERLATAAWASDTLQAWTEDPQAANAWAYLSQAREFLDGYLSGHKLAEPPAIARAYRAALLAEGADWFGGGGAVGAGSGDIEAAATPAAEERARYLDATFRAWLSRVYTELGAPVPDYVRVPLRQAVAVSAETPAPATLTPTIDGLVVEGEWDGAGTIDLSSVNPDPDLLFDAARLAANEDSLFVRLDAAYELGARVGDREAQGAFRLGVYLRLPGATASGASQFTRVEAEGESRAALGFEATHLAEWVLDPSGAASATLYRANSNGGWSEAGDVHSAAVGRVLEMALDRASLDGLAPGAQIEVRLAARSGAGEVSLVPAAGTAQVTVQ